MYEHIFATNGKMITNDHILPAHGMFTFQCCVVQLHEQTDKSLFLNNSYSNACFTLVSKVTIHFKIFNANSMLSMLHTGLANFQNCPCGVSLRIFYRMLGILGWDLSYHL